MQQTLHVRRHKGVHTGQSRCLRSSVSARKLSRAASGERTCLPDCVMCDHVQSRGMPVLWPSQKALCWSASHGLFGVGLGLGLGGTFLKLYLIQHLAAQLQQTRCLCSPHHCTSVALLDSWPLLLSASAILQPESRVPCLSMARRYRVCVRGSKQHSRHRPAGIEVELGSTDSPSSVSGCTAACTRAAPTIGHDIAGTRDSVGLLPDKTLRPLASMQR